MRIYRQLMQFYRSVRRVIRLWQYTRSGRKPWTVGYRDFRDKIIHDTLQSTEMLQKFVSGQPLGNGYGPRMDERVVEYPWIVSRLGSEPGALLDAGSTLNNRTVLAHQKFQNKTIVIYNLSPEGTVSKPNISYIYGDLRDTILKSELFDVVTCISVLEHIGMNNTLLYSKDDAFNEAATDSYSGVIQEFRRLMKPGGQLLITIPYGQYENHGWLQQFDAGMVDHVIQQFSPSRYSLTFFKYSPDGWDIATAEECADCHYYNVHQNPVIPPDYAAAARAIVCIEMIK